MRRKTKRHPLLVYKLVLATTRAANRVHFVLEIIIMMMIGKNFMTRSMMTMTVRMMFQVTWWNYGASHVDADDDSDGDDHSDDDDDDNDDDDDDDNDIKMVTWWNPCSTPASPAASPPPPHLPSWL